ncbi:MAG: GHMP kinase, partial [Acidimicrobiales bacterium]
PQIDHWYGTAMAAGAVGGKLCGAGGGGFFLFVVPDDRKPAVRAALGLKELAIDHEPHGSLVVASVNGP